MPGCETPSASRALPPKRPWLDSTRPIAAISCQVRWQDLSAALITRLGTLVGGEGRGRDAVRGGVGHDLVEVGAVAVERGADGVGRSTPTPAPRWPRSGTSAPSGRPDAVSSAGRAGGGGVGRRQARRPCGREESQGNDRRCALEAARIAWWTRQSPGKRVPVSASYPMCAVTIPNEVSRSRLRTAVWTSAPSSHSYRPVCLRRCDGKHTMCPGPPAAVPEWARCRPVSDNERGESARATARRSGAGVRQLFARARAVIPGGVSSPVRAFDAVGGTPRFIRSAQGAWLTDVDGHDYVDLVGSWGPMLLGHAHPEVLAAVRRGRGTRHVLRHAHRARGRARRGDRARGRRSSGCGSCRPAPRPPCRRSGWPAASPAATSS